MVTFNQRSRLVMARSIFIFLGLMVPAAAFAECPGIPTDVPWWKNTSHDAIKEYVDSKYTGDWGKYVKKWEGQLDKLQQIFDRGSAVVVTKDKIKLEGDLLQNYIDKVGLRVEAIRCYAELDGKMIEKEAGELAALDTAAGSGSGGDATTVELAQVAGIASKLQISGKCEANEAFFQVTNVGEPWPEPGKFVLYRTDDKTMVSELSLRLAEEQSLADIPHMPSKFVEFVPLSHRQGNCIPYAAIRWHDFGNRPALGRPLGHFSRHPDTPLLSLSPRRRFPRPTPERVFVADHQSSSGFSGTGPSAPPPQPIGT